MNLVLLLMVFAGIILIMSNELVASRRKPMIKYKYLPRDLDTYIRQEPYASVTYKNMMEDEDVWTKTR